jgi:hypothetical protein
VLMGSTALLAHRLSTDDAEWATQH